MTKTSKTKKKSDSLFQVPTTWRNDFFCPGPWGQSVVTTGLAREAGSKKAGPPWLDQNEVEKKGLAQGPIVC